MSKEEALRAILDAPDDDQLRLLYASLIEREDAARARFIQVQVALASKIDPMKRRALVAEEKKLLREHSRAWSASVVSMLPASVDGTIAFARGFVDAVAVPANDAVIDALPKMLAIAPLRRLRLTSISSAMFQRLLNLDVIGRLRTLETSGPIGDEAVRKLAKSEQLASLQNLILTHGQMGDDAGAALVQSKHLMATTLGMSDNALGERTFAALAHIAATQTATPKSETVGLQALYVPENAIEAESLAALLRSPLNDSLRAVGMRACGLDDDGATRLLAPDALPHVSRLDLESNEMSAETREALRARYGRRIVIEREHGGSRSREPLVELRGQETITRMTPRWLAEWAAAVGDAAFGVDLFMMEGWARDESAPCARCKTTQGKEALSSTGRPVDACPTCEGQGVTRGPPRPWASVERSALSQLLERLPKDGRLLEPRDCATAADLLVEAGPRISSEWRDVTELVIEGLRVAWSSARPLTRRS
jgi:uncharacterized protein (TIGR02996 family)